MSNTNQNLKQILEKYTIIFSSKICLMNGLNKNWNSTLKHSGRSLHLLSARIKLENLLLSAMDLRTNQTENTDPPAQRRQSKKWTAKRFKEKYFMLIQLRKKVSVNTRSNKKVSNSRFLKNDVIYTWRIFHNKQLKKTLKIYFLVLVKLSHLSSLIRITQHLSHLYASKHQM